MMNANLRLLLAAGTALASTFAVGQTSSTHHRTTSTTSRPHARATHPAARSECVTVPTLSPKIPALRPGSACPKALVTISEEVYLSPLVGPAVREGFSNLPMSFTLSYVDTHIGTGPLAQPHMWYTVQYTGYLTDGTKFDSSLDHPDKKPISFPYGAHRVILGWDLGFEGMHVGGKRRLFVPFQLGYGDRGKPPVIPAKAELVFDLELVAQNPTNPDAPPAPPTPPTPPGAPAAPRSPGTLPATPPTGSPSPATAPPMPPASAQPQRGPDVKPAPPVPGTAQTPHAPDSTTKPPPPQGL